MIKNRIAIICFYPFPKGMAATNRIIAYSKGLIGNGAKVDVFLMNPSDFKGTSLYPSRGNFEGINYNYPIGRIRFRFKLFHFFEIILGIFATLFTLYKNQKYNKIDSLIISSELPFILFLFTRFARMTNVKSIFIFDEYPSVMRKSGLDRLSLFTRWKYDFALKKVSGMVSIIDKLLEVYNINLKKPSIVLSTITDTSKYSPNHTNVKFSGRDYLCYMGSLDLTKDNVDLIIKAFNLLKYKYTNIDLHVYGNASGEDNKKLLDLIFKLGLKDRVILKGQVNGNEVPNILMNAKVLVTSQTNSLRIKGGLSTKLGEYLASGVPCLLTDVGQISKHVENNEHVFLVKPDSVHEYAETLNKILDDYAEAVCVAKKGQKYLFDNFSHIVMGKKLLDFIENL
jgi:glycosyltransferase involved in cell wall biosynthesis